MAFMPSGILRDLQSINSRSFPVNATIARTGAVIPCRVVVDERPYRIPGLGDWAHVPFFRLTFPLTADLTVSDRVSVPGFGTFLLIDRNPANAYPVAIKVLGVLAQTTATASTQRVESWTDPANPVIESTQIASLTLRSLTSTLFTPVSSQFVADMFGVQVMQPAYVLADWPGGSAEFPLRPNDDLVVGGASYKIRQIERTPAFLVLYVQLPATA